MRLYVAVNDSVFVCVVERTHYLRHHVRRGDGGEGSGTRDHRSEVGAFDQFHHDIPRIAVAPDIVHTDDVRVLKAGGVLGFALEAAQELRVLRVLIAQHLHGHHTIEDGIPPTVHYGHAAVAHLIVYAVATVQRGSHGSSTG